MNPTLRHQLVHLGVPSSLDLQSVNASRHPAVAEWAKWSYNDRTTAGSIAWLAGYRRFGDQFEAAAAASSDPATALQDPWMLVGHAESDFTYPTRKLIDKWYNNDLGSNGLAQFIQMFPKLGNVPDDFHDTVHWAGGRYIVPQYRWTTWANGVLGKYAATWTMDNLRLLIDSGVKRRQLDMALASLYGVKPEMTRSLYSQVISEVPFAPVAAVLLDGVPADYARELL